MEKPDSVLPDPGRPDGPEPRPWSWPSAGYPGQHGVRLHRHATPTTIDKAEDRELFKETMAKHRSAQSSPPRSWRRWRTLWPSPNRIGYPVMRPSRLHPGRRRRRHLPRTRQSCVRSAANGLRLSRVAQVLVEKCIAGWKEIEYEVMRDQHGQRHHRLLHGEL